MKLNSTTSFNDAIKKMSCGHTGAASVLALIHRERPQNVMHYMHALDKMGVYGQDISNMFWVSCTGELAKFLMEIGSQDGEAG